MRFRVGRCHEVLERVVAVKPFLGVVDGVGSDPSYWSFPVAVRILEWVVSHRGHNGFGADWMLVSMGLLLSGCDVRHQSDVSAGHFYGELLYDL